MHATNQASTIRVFLMMLAIMSVGATITTTTTMPTFTTKVSMAPFVGLKKYQMPSSPPHQNLMVVKKIINKVGCSTIAANKNADETSVCAIAVLHHKNIIMPPTPTGTIIQIFLTDQNNYDLATFANLPDPGGVVFMMMVSIVLLATAAVAAAWYVLSGSSKKKLCNSLKIRKVLERKKIQTLAINNCPCQIQLWLFAGYLAMTITAQGCEKEVMCRRDRPETCRGSSTKLVEVDYDKWTIPAWQTGINRDIVVVTRCCALHLC